MKVIGKGPKPERTWYLSVELFLPSRRFMAKLLSRVDGVEITRWPKFFSSFREAEFLEFNYEGIAYTVEPEPLSGNEYEIHCKPSGFNPETLTLKSKLENIKLKSVLKSYFK